jgi:HD domain-containing protein/FHA domain-containing protein/GAF domain-containing protein
LTRACLRPAPDVPHLPSIFLDKGEKKTIGRSPQADVVIDEPSLSRLHAAVSMNGDGNLEVEDLGSTNGVFINRARLKTGPLAVGDRVVFGILEYLVEEAPAAPALDSFDSTVFRSVKVEEPQQHVDAAAIAALLQTSRELMACTDLPGLLDRVLDRLQPVLKPDRSAILLFDSTSGELTTRAVRPDGAYTSVSDFASTTAVREAIRARELVEVYDAAVDRRLQDAISVARAGVRAALCVPLLGRTGPIGALYCDQIWYAGRFTPEQVQYAAAFAAHVAAALETAKLYDDRERHFRATLEAFARAIDARDKYTAGHSERVTAYTLVLARAAGIPDSELETLRRACMMHDIGKVGVPDHVLLKPGPLDQNERAMMEAHVTIGYDMLLPLVFLQDSLPGIRGHHERWDGNGYPDGLAGENIHPHARIMAVADSYDAMTSARPYRNALPLDEAARRVRKDIGRQFAPKAVEAFDAVEAELRAVHSHARPLTKFEDVKT